MNEKDEELQKMKNLKDNLEENMNTMKVERNALIEQKAQLEDQLQEKETFQQKSLTQNEQLRHQLNQVSNRN